MLSDNDFDKAVGLINESGSVLLAAHTKPDGDACGSMVAMAEVLASLGKKVETILLSEVPEWYAFLFDKKPLILGEDISIEQLKGEVFDLIILVDVNSESQLPGFAEVLEQHKAKVLVFDHHVSNDGLGDVELVDSSAAATGLIVFDFLRYAGWAVTEKIAGALFAAIATDTGWFRFRNTDSRALAAASELFEAGADAPQLYCDLFLNFSHGRFKLMTAMLNTLELCFDGRLATQFLLQKDFEEAQATFKDTENLIDECRRIGSVEAAVLFVEMKDGRIRCSLRSTGSVDVCKIAQKFGGGGHKMAAGATVAGSLQEAMESIKAEIGKQLS